MKKTHRKFFVAALLVSIIFPTALVRGVDQLTSLTGMDDSPYYRYEVRGQSSVSLRLSQSLWEGGATQARIDMEKARLASSRHVYQDAAASLAFDAVASHLEILRQTSLVSLASRNVEDYANTIDMLHSRVANGLATSGDIDLVRSRLLRAQGVLAEYKSALLGAKANFEKITGRPAPKILAEVTIPKKIYRSADAAIKASLTHNPRILAQGAAIEASQHEEKVAKGGYYPKFAVEAGPRWHFQDTPQDSRNHGVEAMLTMQWNLYDGGATKAATAKASAQTRQARYDQQNIADSIKSEILSVWAQYQAAAERMEFYGQSMEVAKGARGILYEQYLLGYKGLLDILDADNEYFIAASQHAVAKGDHLVAAYRLLALGGEILSGLGVNLPDPEGGISENSQNVRKK